MTSERALLWEKCKPGQFSFIAEPAKRVLLERREALACMKYVIMNILLFEPGNAPVASCKKRKAIFNIIFLSFLIYINFHVY